MFTSFKPKECSIRFETFSEAIKYADTHKDASTAARETSDRGYYSNGWHGTNSFEKAVELAKKGFPEGRKKIQEFKAALDQRLESAHYNRQEVVFDVVGTGGFDMGEVMTGVPEAAMEWVDNDHMDKRQSNQGKVIKFLVNITASCNVSAEVMAYRGAVVGALIDCLEHEGYSVEVETLNRVTTGYGSSGGVVDIRVPVKSAGEHLQLDMLAFALVCPAFFRRMGFVHIAKCGPLGLDASKHAYGYPDDVEPDQLTTEQVDLYFPRAYGTEAQWNSKEAAIAWIQDQLKLFGIDVKEAEGAPKVPARKDKR